MSTKESGYVSYGFRMIPCVDAGIIPYKVMEYCKKIWEDTYVTNELNHKDLGMPYKNDIIEIGRNDINPLADWLRSIGIKLDDNFNYVAIIK